MMPFLSLNWLLISSSVCISLTLFTPPVLAYALPEACTGVCVNAHDPSLIRRPDGTYFRFSTGGKIAVHTAPTITGPWTYKGAALPRGSSINLPGNQDLWAPDITPHNTTHYSLLYSVSTFGSQTSALGLALSTTIDPGSWTDLGPVITSSPGKTPYNAIDGNLFKLSSASGNTYLLSLGSFWSGLYQTQISLPSTSGTTITPTQISYNPADKAQEAPYVFYHQNWYYLFYSKGTCCGYDRTRPAKDKEYKIMVCRSTVPNGGFVDKTGRSCTNGGGSVVLESHGWVYGPGGQGVYYDEALKAVMLYYHYVDTRVGYADGMKRFGWNKVNFSGGWPVV